MVSKMAAKHEIDQLDKRTFRSRYVHTPFGSAPVSILLMKIETDYIFCNKVKEGVSAIRRFDWSRENIRHTGIQLAFVGPYVSYNR